MAKPVYPTISSGLEGWDADLQAITAILSGPVPLPLYSSFAALPTAANYDDCLAVYNKGAQGSWPSGKLIALSRGGAWSTVGFQCAFQAQSSAGTLAALVTDFNTLLTALKTSGLMAPA